MGEKRQNTDPKFFLKEDETNENTTNKLMVPVTCIGAAGLFKSKILRKEE